MKKLFALAAVALTLCGLLTACGNKTETANDVDLTGFYNALAEQYGWGDDMMDLDGEMLEMYYPGLGDIPAKQLLAKAPVMSYASMCSCKPTANRTPQRRRRSSRPGSTVRRTGMPSILRPLTSGRLPRCCKTAPMWQ